MAFKIFTFYLLFTLIIQIVTAYYFEFKIHNMHISHYYFIGQLIILSYFFFVEIKKRIIRKLITIISITVLLFLVIFYSKNPEKYFIFNEFEILATSIPLMFYSFFFFFDRIERSNKNFIYIISGFFIYILCSTLLFTVANISSGIKIMIWYLNAILYILFQVLVFIEWYKHFRKKEIPS